MTHITNNSQALMMKCSLVAQHAARNHVRPRTDFAADLENIRCWHTELTNSRDGPLLLNERLDLCRLRIDAHNKFAFAVAHIKDKVCSTGGHISNSYRPAAEMMVNYLTHHRSAARRLSSARMRMCFHYFF